MIFRRFPKIFQNCSEGQTNAPEHFPRICENFRRCPKISEDYITHIHKYNNVASNRPSIDMVLKNKSGIAFANVLTIFIVIYGVKWYQNDVDTGVWDRVYELVNNTVKYEALVEVKDPVRPGSKSHYKESARSWHSKNGVSIFVLS